MANNKFVAGAGITGLIWGFYHPEFEIIAPVQDQPVKDNYLRSAFVWMHDCYETRRLLSDLGWENVEKLTRQSRIGYFNDGLITDRLTPELNNKIILRKMTSWADPIPQDKKKSFIPSVTALSMTSNLGNNFMNVLTVDLGEVMKRLLQRVKITHGYILGFYKSESGQHFLKMNNGPGSSSDISLVYSELISTIPAPIFYKIYQENHLRPLFNSLPITNVIVDKKPDHFAGDYEMVYYDTTQPFSRISHLNGKYAFEFTGVILKEEFEKMFPDYGVLDYFVMPYGRIFSVDNPAPHPGVTFSGRFAQWCHSVTTEHVIHQALTYREK